MTHHEGAHLLAGLMTVAELACAAGLAIPRTRTAAAWATAAVFVLVFPGYVTMAVRASGKDPR